MVGNDLGDLFIEVMQRVALSTKKFFAEQRSPMFQFLTVSMIFVSIVLLVYYRLFFVESTTGSNALNSLQRQRWEQNSSYSFNLPNIAHHMWKDRESVPSDLTKWRQGCIQLNSEYNFKFYTDKELKLLAKELFPEHYELFSSLHGVCKSILNSCCCRHNAVAVVGADRRLCHK